MITTGTTVAEASPAVLAVVAAQLVGPYTLALTFSTGEQRTVDFGPFLRQARHPAIRAYLDETCFQQFKLVQGNVNWNDYDLIFPVADLFSGSVR
ncbi:DUF2442 domain-containing protein [Hymenobacter caeli]|uniref:DUF2442 domain-containing protein n=1 Tax=Hymenobacter caeli TaxID=2735894 RepID=A0ABX2FKE9_9BACT|nr:DUF2442 domain-containing protein [Hymenobacter caeli]NRT17596.1 hypothetical protein [Hymenobacter caeli]